MKKLKLGVVGLGGRGSGMLNVLLKFDFVEFVAVCDKYEDRVENAYKKINETNGDKPQKYLDFDKFILDEKIEAVFIFASWDVHIEMAIASMKAGKMTAMEVGGAKSVEECYDLVTTYEQTKTPFVMLENCCFDRFEMLAKKLTDKGYFGEVVHCRGIYGHDIREEIMGGNVNRHYRLKEYLNFNCENYPTHELGPICRVLNINKGNRIVKLVSVASKSRGLTDFSYTDRNPDKTLIGASFKQGDIVETILQCENGETISLTLDTTLPRYYSRGFTVRGTKGFAMQELNAIVSEVNGERVAEEYETTNAVKKLIDSAEKYKDELPPYWKNVTEEEKALGHGGMDYFMCKEILTAMKNGEQMPIDVYDAATWMVVSVLSAKSIENGGTAVDFPDFTNGKWKTR